MNLAVRLTVLFLICAQWMCWLAKNLLSAGAKARSVPPSDDPLLKLSAVVLAEKIRQRKIFSQEVVQVYIARIKEVNPIVNAVIEERFEEALKEAKEADLYLDHNQEVIEQLKVAKPFLGVPITIKESIAVKGLSYTGCSLNRKGIKADKDAIVVQRLKAAGLIPLLVSSTPEYCCGLETYNKIIGYTHNPYNTLYTSGGSSGGEGALLGAGASLIGIGSDLCGSIRIPAVFSGIFGHKPTGNIVPLEGHWPLPEDEFYRQSLTLGPMARYAEDLRPLLEIMTGASAQALRLNEKVDLSEVRVFYMEDCGSSFGLLDVQKEIRTAVKMATAYLSRECHCHVSNHKFEELAESMEVVSSNLMRFKSFPSPLTDTDTKYSACWELLKELFGKSKFTMHLLTFAVSYYSNKFATYRSEHYKQKLEEIKNVLTEELGDNGVLIYPCVTGGATALGGYFIGLPFATYVGIPNLTGLPATALPTGFNSRKLPVGIQIIAGPKQDRLTLAVAQELEKCFGGWQPVP